MIQITNAIAIPDHEIEISAIRSQGAGGQKVNKTSTAIHLRFDIKASSLADVYKERLLALKDNRISQEGVVVIKAQRYRSQEKNRADAIERLCELVRSVTRQQAKRIPTKATRASKQRRLHEKGRRGQIKALRQRIRGSDD